MPAASASTASASATATVAPRTQPEMVFFRSKARFKPLETLRLKIAAACANFVLRGVVNT